MKKLGLMMIVLLLTLTGCAKPEEKGQTIIIELEGKKADMSGYAGFTTTDHNFYRVTLNESNRVFSENGSAILYFGYNDCPWCVNAVPVINTVAKELDLKIYYVDISSKEGNEQADYDALIGYVKDKLKKDDKGIPVLYVPQVFVVKDGVVVDDHMGTVESHDAHERMINDAEKKQLADIYSKMFKKLK